MNMNFMLRKNKGLTITLSAILEGLLLFGIIALLLWIFISRIFEVHVISDQISIERKSLNLANILISSDKLCYESNGKIYRGILDANKLDTFFVKNDYPIQVDIGIGYPNSINIVSVVDLESCNPDCLFSYGECENSFCDGWFAYLSAPISLEGFSTSKFFTCMIENFKPMRAIFGWYHQDLEKCVKYSQESTGISIFYTKGAPVNNGLPILIRYTNGELHIGRIFVLVVGI
ncbi:MAG: hypothetical protein QXY79_01300 [Candidatus Methanomethylicia archaeon]